jgi:hypothetical protein
MSLGTNIFPKEKKHRGVEDPSALSQQTIEGMVINRHVHGLDEAMVVPLLTNLERQIQELRPPAD